jgi:uncharacterized protein
MSPSETPTSAPGSPGLAVVTGASSGIGRSLARELGARGFSLLVVADDTQIRDAEQELRSEGAVVRGEQLDLSTADGVEALYRCVQEAGEPVTVAALNAGIGVGGPFVDTDLDADLRLVDLNCRSTVHVAKLLLRDMVRRGHGRLMVTASIVAKAPGPWNATYAASKAFVHSFAEGIRVELKDTGVTVTSLMPGATDTEFFERANMEDTRVGSGKKDDPDDVARDGVDALMAGKDHVVGGSTKNRAMAAASSASPDPAAARAAAKASEPGSGD